MKTLTVKFTFKTETAGAVRYEEIDAKGKVISVKEGAVVGAIYLRKDKIGTKAPKSLTITIEGSGVVAVEAAKEKKAAKSAPASDEQKKAVAKKKVATAKAPVAVKKSAAKKKAVKK